MKQTQLLELQDNLGLLQAARHINSEVKALEDLVDASHRLVEQSSDSRARSLQGSPARGPTQDSFTRVPTHLTVAVHAGCQSVVTQSCVHLLKPCIACQLSLCVHACAPDRVCT